MLPLDQDVISLDINSAFTVRNYIICMHIKIMNASLLFVGLVFGYGPDST